MKLIIRFFLWGFLAGGGALVAEVFLLIVVSIFYFPAEKFFGSLSEIGTLWLIPLAFLEELFKFVVIAKIVHPATFGKTLIANTFLTGAGFALWEIVLIREKFASENIFSSEFWSIAGLTVLHITTAGIMGYFIAKRNSVNFQIFLKSIFWTTFFHFWYNFFLSQEKGIFIYFVFAIITLLILINLRNLSTINRKLAQ